MQKLMEGEIVNTTDELNLDSHHLFDTKVSSDMIVILKINDFLSTFDTSFESKNMDELKKFLELDKTDEIYVTEKGIKCNLFVIALFLIFGLFVSMLAGMIGVQFFVKIFNLGMNENIVYKSIFSMTAGACFWLYFLWKKDNKKIKDFFSFLKCDDNKVKFLVEINKMLTIDNQFYLDSSDSLKDDRFVSAIRSYEKNKNTIISDLKNSLMLDCFKDTIINMKKVEILKSEIDNFKSKTASLRKINSVFKSELLDIESSNLDNFLSLAQSNTVFKNSNSLSKIKDSEEKLKDFL